MINQRKSCFYLFQINFKFFLMNSQIELKKISSWFTKLMKPLCSPYKVKHDVIYNKDRNLIMVLTYLIYSTKVSENTDRV